MSSFKKIGNWDLAGMMTDDMAKNIEKSNKIVLGQIGAETERGIVLWIEKQPSIWPRNNDKYKKWKEDHGFSNLILRKTSTLINSITSKLEYPKVFVGVKRGATYKSGEEVANVAAIMEFGSVARNIPARPYLRPVFRVMTMKIRRDMLFQKRLLELLKRKYGI